MILRTSAGGRTERIVVGKPSDGPSGGRVVALVDLPRSLRGTVCPKGKGPKFAILGTNGADRITGTNRADRIMTLGGKDKAAGGRENGCLDGGAGGGTLTGDQGKDTVVGGSGRDAIKGGADADRLVGRGGADRITSDFGKDRVDAGSGNDFVNVSINGPAASVNCGPGRDRVSLNRNEVRKARGCERTAVLTKRRA